MFRPCIDLHQGQVKQIVGGSLAHNEGAPVTNFVSDRPSRWYAELYRRDGLEGGHVIMLGPGNEPAAIEALAAWPGGLQIGGGITLDNARRFMDLGASHLIVTSYVFHGGQIDQSRLRSLVAAVGKERLVLDLSCRIREGAYWVVTDRWRTFTQCRLNPELFASLHASCAEFLVHAVDVEGLCQGVDLELVKNLAAWSPLTITYAGGARSLDDLAAVDQASQGRVHLTIGSALDIFGGSGVRYADAVEFNRRAARIQGSSSTR